MNKSNLELQRYIEVTPMTPNERLALEEWVAGGNSVHSNPSMAEDDHGNPLSFLEDYRYHEELRNILEPLTEDERQAYIDRLLGIETEPLHPLNNDGQWPF